MFDLCLICSIKHGCPGKSNRYAKEDRSLANIY
jgi:hypothetical protein